MRFSSIFQLPTVPPQSAGPAGEALPAEEPREQRARPAPDQHLPEDLDARVRLIGEWQLGEGY